MHNASVVIWLSESVDFGCVVFVKVFLLTCNDNFMFNTCTLN